MKNLINWQKSIPHSIDQHLQHPFLSLQREVDQVINDFYKNFAIPNHAPSVDMEKFNINPSIDIFENEQMYKVEVEMPGVGQEDVKVAIDNGILSILGKKEISKKDQGRNYLMREIGYGSYQRDIALPSYVDIDKAKASFKKGMLWVTFPKKGGTKKQNQRELKIEEL